MSVLVVTSDMFFIAKIESVANIVGIKIAFVKNVDELMAKAKLEVVNKIILDLNSSEFNAIETIERIRKDQSLSKVPIIGYLSHADMGDLGLAAKNAGCDYVMPKSVFSESLAQILKS